MVASVRTLVGGRMKIGLLALTALSVGLVVGPVPAALAAAAPAAPADLELHAASDSSITLEWPATPGATSYRIYRATSAGGESATPLATTTALSYKDTNLSSTPIYFYQVTAVNAGGESARGVEEASKTPPPVPTGGTVAGVSSG